ncbi:MAG: hypothetical protein Fur009_0210 [Candidatus Microgenomates bacterium]
MFTRTLSNNAQNTLALLGAKKILPENTYLAGGSSLALQIDHRISIDFDFFTSTNFFTEEIDRKLNEVGRYQKNVQTPKTMVGNFNNIKFSLFYYPYKLISKPLDFLGIKLAQKEDIAAMKLVAITDRGTKKDFIDLYFLAKFYFPIEKMFEFYNKKYQLF